MFHFSDVNHTCASECGTGWWFLENATESCFDTKLTGRVDPPQDDCSGMYWKAFTGTTEEEDFKLKKVVMRVMDWNATIASRYF